MIEGLLTDADGDEECDIREHLPQYVPEVSLSTAVAVLHQLCAPQNCKGSVSVGVQYVGTLHYNPKI